VVWSAHVAFLAFPSMQGGSELLEREERRSSI
jgi:hypothetical protein